MFKDYYHSPMPSVAPGYKLLKELEGQLHLTQHMRFVALLLGLRYISPSLRCGETSHMTGTLYENYALIIKGS